MCIEAVWQMWNKSKTNAGHAGHAARAAQRAVFGLPVCCCSLEVLGEGGWPGRVPRKRWDQAVIRLVTPDIKLLTCAGAASHPEVTGKIINVSKRTQREPLSRKGAWAGWGGHVKENLEKPAKC